MTKPGSASRARLLVLSQVLPFPPDSGVKSRTFNVLRQLARGYDIHALCFSRRSGVDADSDVRERVRSLAPYATVEAFPIPQEHSRLRFVYDHLRSGVLRRSYIHYVYESAAFRSRLRELLTERRFDLVHADSLDLAGYFEEVSGLPLICVHHDVQSRLLARRAQAMKSWFGRRYTAWQATLMEQEERDWFGRVALNVMVSEVDRHTALGLAPAGRFTVVPNGVDVEFFRPRDELDGRAMVFVGSAGWFPNRDGILYFIREILPRVRQQVPDAVLRWIGWVDPDTARTLAGVKGVELLGHVPDIRPILGSAGCAVVPLRVGGGTRVKILDAWAMGVAVVSTTVGCEGLEARVGSNILVADDPRGFAEAIGRVLTNESLRSALGREARATAESSYSWAAIGNRMLADYRACLPAGS